MQIKNNPSIVNKITMDRSHMTVGSYTVSVTPPHWHDFFEYELFLEGSGTIKINDNIYPIRRGTLYFINIPDIHAIQPDNPVNILNASFDSSLIKDDTIFMYLSNVVSTCILLTEEEIEYFSALHFMLKNEYKSIIPLTRLHVTAILETIIIFILKKIHENNISINREITASHRMQEAIKYINTHFSENITLQKSASIAFLSKEHFSRKFHEYVGLSFSNYLLSIRMKYAKNLLATSTLPIAEISIRSGFNSANHFSRMFRKSFGITPNAYRNTLKEIISE